MFVFLLSLSSSLSSLDSSFSSFLVVLSLTLKSIKSVWLSLSLLHATAFFFLGFGDLKFIEAFLLLCADFVFVFAAVEDHISYVSSLFMVGVQRSIKSIGSEQRSTEWFQ